MRVNINRWSIAALIAVSWVTVVDGALGLGIVVLVLASWVVSAFEKLAFMTPPILFARTIFCLYAFGWMTEYYTGLSPWLSIPIGLTVVMIAAGATSDPYYGIKKER